MNVNALAMIQPWHPAMMYLIYCAVSEEDMLEHRVKNQPIPAGRLEMRPWNAEDWGSISDTVHAHKSPTLWNSMSHCASTQKSMCIHPATQDVEPPRKSPRYTPGMG